MKTPKTPSELKALAIAVKALSFEDASDYGTALWEIVTEIGGPRAVSLLESNANLAYKVYVDREV